MLKNLFIITQAVLEQSVHPLLSDSHLVMAEEKEVQHKTNGDNEPSALETILRKLKSSHVSDLELKVTLYFTTFFQTCTCV